jgi:hypothetical protein
MTLHFSKNVGSKVIVEYLHFDWHFDISFQTFSLLLSNSTNLDSFFSKEFFKWIQVIP